MEELLNKLIKKGRVPFGIYGNGDLEGERIYIEEQDEYTNEYRLKVYWINVDYVEFNGLCDEDKHFSDRFSLREIASKGSGLWQFVCDREHRFIDKKNYEGVRLDKRLKNPYADYDDVNTEYEWITSLNYKYWIIESSLKDESELERFLLDSIKIEGQQER